MKAFEKRLSDLEANADRSGPYHFPMNGDDHAAEWRKFGPDGPAGVFVWKGLNSEAVAAFHAANPFKPGNK